MAVRWWCLFAIGSARGQHRQIPAPVRRPSVYSARGPPPIGERSGDLDPLFVSQSPIPVGWTK